MVKLNNIKKLLKDFRKNKKKNKEDLLKQLKRLEYWKNIINTSAINFDIEEKLYKKDPNSKFTLIFNCNYCILWAAARQRTELLFQFATDVSVVHGSWEY